MNAQGPPSLDDLYLAWRQVKRLRLFERSGLGLVACAQFEADLPGHLRILQQKLRGGRWFDDLEIGSAYLVPKALRREPTPQESGGVTRVGLPTQRRLCDLDVRVRLNATPEFHLTEVLYIRQFGPALEALLDESVLGYRLNLRTQAGSEGAHSWVDPYRHDLFKYWPTQYQTFRTATLRSAWQLLKDPQQLIQVISADLSSFYDNVDPSFLLDDAFISQLGLPTDPLRARYQAATASLLRAYQRFYTQANENLGTAFSRGLPIGALTSQIFSNLALLKLDQHIQAQGARAYHRYVDDLILVAPAEEARTLQEAVEQFFPVQSATSGQIVLDESALARRGSTFTLHPQKLSVYYLRGESGREFIEALLKDFYRLIFSQYGLLDLDTLLHNRLAQLIRAHDQAKAQIRTLRAQEKQTADRFALSQSLKTLEEASLMLDPIDLLQVLAPAVEAVQTQLRAEEDWVEVLNTGLRLFKIALTLRDWPQVDQLSRSFEAIFATTQSVRNCARTLRHNGRNLTPQGAPHTETVWQHLCDTLQQQYIEALVSAMPAQMREPTLRKRIPSALRMRTVDLHRPSPSALNLRALLGLARSLARADLRSRDCAQDDRWTREDHTSHWVASSLKALQERFQRIRVFLNECARLDDPTWLMPPARLFLATRPPSYLDISSRLLHRATQSGIIAQDVFTIIMEVVNAIRGNFYREPAALYPEGLFFEFPKPAAQPSTNYLHSHPLLILGNVFKPDPKEAPDQDQVLERTRGTQTMQRLVSLIRVLEEAIRRALISHRARMPDSRRRAYLRDPQDRWVYDPLSVLLLLPAQSVPQRWLRVLARGLTGHGAFTTVLGLEPDTPEQPEQCVTIVPSAFCAHVMWSRFKAQDAQKLAPLVSLRAHWGQMAAVPPQELTVQTTAQTIQAQVGLVLCPAGEGPGAQAATLARLSSAYQAVIAAASGAQAEGCAVWIPSLDTQAPAPLLCALQEHRTGVVQTRLPRGFLMRKVREAQRADERSAEANNRSAENEGRTASGQRSGGE